MSSVETLQEARSLIQGGLPESDVMWARSAALVTRQALEEALYEKLHSAHGVGKSAKFNTQLILLREISKDKNLAAEVAWTWSALSSATHIQGYALPPTLGELQRWLETVERFVASD